MFGFEIIEIECRDGLIEVPVELLKSDRIVTLDIHIYKRIILNQLLTRRHNTSIHRFRRSASAFRPDRAGPAPVPDTWEYCQCQVMVISI